MLQVRRRNAALAHPPYRYGRRAPRAERGGAPWGRGGGEGGNGALTRQPDRTRAARPGGHTTQSDSLLCFFFSVIIYLLLFRCCCARAHCTTSPHRLYKRFPRTSCTGGTRSPPGCFFLFFPPRFARRRRRRVPPDRPTHLQPRREDRFFYYFGQDGLTAVRCCRRRRRRQRPAAAVVSFVVFVVFRARDPHRDDFGNTPVETAQVAVAPPTAGLFKRTRVMAGGGGFVLKELKLLRFFFFSHRSQSVSRR